MSETIGLKSPRIKLLNQKLYTLVVLEVPSTLVLTQGGGSIKGGPGGEIAPTPYFARIEGATGQKWRAALLLATSGPSFRKLLTPLLLI